jgi:DNA-binding protein HU-beta
VSIYYPLKLEGNFMNKSELIDSIADKSGLNKTQAGDALNAVMESVGEALEAGDSISLVGFGTFSVKDRKARTGRNPKTGEELSIPASKVPSFKAGKNLKERLN